MSKIFINHSFKCLEISILPNLHNDDDIPRDIINFVCSDIDSISTRRLLNQIATTIVSNNLFTSSGMSIGSNDNNTGGLIPINSKLYSNGSNTSDYPKIETIKNLLEIKLKIDDVNDSIFKNDDDADDGSAEKLMTGHFRFHLPSIMPPQIFILIKSPILNEYDISKKLLLLFHGNSKFLPVFTSHIEENFNCTITNVIPNNNTLQSCLNWCVINEKLNSIGNIELWFGKLQTKGKLGTIVITIEEKDILMFRDIYMMTKVKGNKDDDDDTNLSVLLYEYLESKTKISFDKLILVKLKCQLFTIAVDGKVKFTSSMSHLGKKSKESKRDNRLTIWWIIRRLFFVN
ncbi:hypothetical protein C6P40_004633 [Pichia californica]|uniref:Uncharacterized protein n=1 Tax=Pichia californica TaxID=460514 RepID=A0A9P7BHP3_9ASCO|nr:hypothetical protein C6P42_000869 [[Candida] californica]KAG0689688.1 hypothetical protein C6P40_004633 [[Candida] californica]